MTVTNIDLAASVVNGVREASKGHPDRMAGLLTGSFIARVLCMFSDMEWEAMKVSASKPCGKPGCGCHEWMPDVMNGLDVLREDARACGVEIFHPADRL